MLICRILSFSLFLFHFLPPITGYQTKCNECNFVIVKESPQKPIVTEPVNVIEVEKRCDESLKPSLEPPIEEDTPHELENSREDIDSGDESISQVVDSFVQSIEGFWQETRRNLNEYKKRKLPPGQWWLKEVEGDYRAMKEGFFNALSPNTPQQCLEILADYEVRYNDIMWAELDKEIKRIQSIGDSDDDEDENPQTHHYAEESLDDAYAALNEKGSNCLNRKNDQTVADTAGICKKPTYADVMYGGKKEKNVTLQNCGEGN